MAYHAPSRCPYQQRNQYPRERSAEPPKRDVESHAGKPQRLQRANQPGSAEAHPTTFSTLLSCSYPHNTLLRDARLANVMET